MTRQKSAYQVVKLSHNYQTFLCQPRAEHFAQHRDTHQQNLVISIHKKTPDNNNYLVIYYSSLKILLFLDNDLQVFEYL